MRIRDSLMTHGRQDAESRFDVCLDGENSSANIISRSVARDQSHQAFYSNLQGNSLCAVHTECDAIIMDEAKISSLPVSYTHLFLSEPMFSAGGCGEPGLRAGRGGYHQAGEVFCTVLPGI